MYGRLLMESYLEPSNISTHSFLKAEDALKIARLSGLGGFLFSDTDRMGLDVQRTANVFFRDSHVRPFEIYA